ncbi:hypothetical protein AX16_007609 [Volvariella volvacea WC 439]|nr:hypothetical protein AX16_007609 [Volvariella volvacea WC 439]
MPHVNIADSTGRMHSIYFIDTGRVLGSNDYHTVFLHHGTAFNGESFRRILPLAASHNLRFVIPFRRDYGQSDKYSDEEAADVQQGKNIYLQNLGAEVANFLTWFLDNNEIPKLSKDRSKGGLSLLGWSMGSTTAFAFLGQPEVIAPDVYKRVEPYIKNIVIYDSPFVHFGFDAPREGYHPLFDPEVKTPEQAGLRVSEWLTTHYKHAPDYYTSTKLDGRFDIRRTGDRSSLDNMTPEEQAAMIQLDSAGRSDIGFAQYDKARKILSDQTERVLFDENMAKRVLPDMKLILISCDESPWYFTWAYAAAKERYEKLVKEGKKIRPLNFVIYHGMNHFGHWDEPDRWMNLLIENLEKN